MKDPKEISRKEKQTPGEIVVENRFVRWLENVWYHHNWQIVLVAFFLLVLLVCTVQCSSRETHDVNVTFAGPVDFQGKDEQLQTIQSLLTRLLQSVEGEESSSVGCPIYSIYTEEELRALYTDEDGNFSQYGYSGAVSANSQRMETLSSYFNTGDCSVWLVNEFTYEHLNMKDRAVPLAETFGEAPNGAYDDCAIRLGDTELYQYYEALQELPADTLVVLMRKYIYTNDADYAQDAKLYKAMLEFRAPQ